MKIHPSQMLTAKCRSSFDQLKDSLLNSKVVPEDWAELHSLWRVLEMPLGPQQKTPTRLLKPQRERERETETFWDANS